VPLGIPGSRFHNAQQFYAYMAPMGPVQCEQLFLRDPRFNRPVVGDDGGKRLWVIAESIVSTERILREGWPERERLKREREAKRAAQRTSKPSASGNGNGGAPAPTHAVGGTPGKRPRGRPPKPKTKPEEPRQPLLAS